ncbi:hypothetical protein [Novosphingobium sp.]|uniref:hypothetical protein n=1 Tax=Novosphingobium sp. TaxID=1874826 RepID=UPI00286B0473|nr:hypothetical protein [Novosphingobium sp.]
MGREILNRRLMTYATDSTNQTWRTRLRERLGDRSVAVVLTLLIEALLILAILSLGAVQDKPRKPAGGSLVSVSFDADTPAHRPAKAVAQIAYPAETAQKPLTAPIVPVSEPAAPLPHPVVTPSAAPRRVRSWR